MRAQPTDIRQIDSPITCLTAAGSPLQRQILLWQHELLRRLTSKSCGTKCPRRESNSHEVALGGF
jgi:hypothetical protein